MSSSSCTLLPLLHPTWTCFAVQHWKQVWYVLSCNHAFFDLSVTVRQLIMSNFYHLVTQPVILVFSTPKVVTKKDWFSDIPKILTITLNFALIGFLVAWKMLSTEFVEFIKCLTLFTALENQCHRLGRDFFRLSLLSFFSAGTVCSHSCELNSSSYGATHWHIHRLHWSCGKLTMITLLCDSCSCWKLRLASLLL